MKKTAYTKSTMRREIISRMGSVESELDSIEIACRLHVCFMDYCIKIVRQANIETPLGHVQSIR